MTALALQDTTVVDPFALLRRAEAGWTPQERFALFVAQRERPALMRAVARWSRNGPLEVLGVGVNDRVAFQVTRGSWRYGRVVNWIRQGDTDLYAAHIAVERRDEADPHLVVRLRANLTRVSELA